MAKSFKQMAQKDADAYIIVDALNLAFRYKHSKKQDFAEDYLRTVQSLANSYKADNILITADWGSSSYRCGILPEYKGNRKEKYEKQTEQEAEEFRLFMEDYEKTLKLLAIHYPVFRYKNVEADDIAAQLVAELKGNTIKVGDTIYRGNTPMYEIDHRTGRVYKVAKGIPFVKVEE